eukprot:CAMPEP_0113942588 /NCGR_PEP_ID=MMETSP1339-20121228/8272_1 /TAXON_ID=94617 /ORGANISM="Fibrocapsa japonica" /LENGTH=326 /DNA_ID=CAMNT_0000947111 /DNA_START=164 /DNA_END=1144 /DNA_ORIENTATION=+ /assembly_acc=CAM_ASM_000762
MEGVSAELNCPSGESTVIKCLFSDVDGTVVHYSVPQEEEPTSTSNDGRSLMLHLPPSKTGLRGIISRRTIELAEMIQERGVPFVLVTAARPSTLNSRLPYLPVADVYIIENGGQVLFNIAQPLGKAAAEKLSMANENPVMTSQNAGSDGATAVVLVQDQRWAQGLASGRDQVQALGDKLVDLGWEVDRKDRVYMIRVKTDEATPGKTVSDLISLVKSTSVDLQHASNLGFIDVFPSGSGKDVAAKYVAQLLGVDINDCAMMGDDDNDMKLAQLAGQGMFLTGVFHPSVQEAMENRPGHFHQAQASGPSASEEMLLRILERCPSYGS